MSVLNVYDVLYVGLLLNVLNNFHCLFDLFFCRHQTAYRPFYFPYFSLNYPPDHEILSFPGNNRETAYQNCNCEYFLISDFKFYSYCQSLSLDFDTLIKQINVVFCIFFFSFTLIYFVSKLY